MTKTFSTHTLPHYVDAYLGKPVTLKTDGNSTWTFKGRKREISVTALTAAEARQKVRVEVGKLDNRYDARRLHVGP